MRTWIPAISIDCRDTVPVRYHHSCAWHLPDVTSCTCLRWTSGRLCGPSRPLRAADSPPPTWTSRCYRGTAARAACPRAAAAPNWPYRTPANGGSPSSDAAPRQRRRGRTVRGLPGRRRRRAVCGGVCLSAAPAVRQQGTARRAWSPAWSGLSPCAAAAATEPSRPTAVPSGGPLVWYTALRCS